MNHREIEIYEHMARGRQLRSQAFIAAIASLVRFVKGGFAAAPGGKVARTH